MALAVGNQTYLSDLPKMLIAWHSRDSGAGSISGVSTVETGWIRIDNIPIRNGYHYLFLMPEVNITCSTTTTVGTVKLRYNLAGTATTSSTAFTYGGFFRKAQGVDLSNTDVETGTAVYHATADGTMSVIVTLIRASAAGTVGLFASTANTSPLFVYEMGIAPATSGVDL